MSGSYFRDHPHQTPYADRTDPRHTSPQAWSPTCNKKRMTNQDDEAIRTYAAVLTRETGTGAGSAGQSGDEQGLSDLAEAGPESVEELVQEGQSYEAEVISGVEGAPDADVSQVHTKQVNEDDVPSEYLGQDY